MSESQARGLVEQFVRTNDITEIAALFGVMGTKL